MEPQPEHLRDIWSGAGAKALVQPHPVAWGRCCWGVGGWSPET